MQVWIVTGGIGCGKSTVMEVLARRLEPAGCRLFSADLAVHEELTKAATRKKLTQLFGPAVLADDGQIDRAKLRAMALGETALRKQLERILHPLVRQQFTDLVTDSRHALGAGGTMLAEIPLFHESDDLYPCDLSIMVAASGATQIQRICASRAIAPAEAEAFIQAQLPISFKIKHSNTVIWNDGSRAVLEEQTALLAAMRDAA